MERHCFTGWSGVVVVGATVATFFGLAAEPAVAGDRRGGSSSAHEAHATMRDAFGGDRGGGSSVAAMRSSDGGAGAQRGRANALDDFLFSPTAHGDALRSRPGERASNEDNKAESAPTAPRERKSVTLFRFNSKLGEVAVEPVIGSIKGAQFSFGF